MLHEEYGGMVAFPGIKIPWHNFSFPYVVL
jgi:hypothetical protein